jgi:hypothetical protein
MDFYRAAAHFTILYIVTHPFIGIKYHRDLLPAVGTGKEVFHFYFSFLEKRLVSHPGSIQRLSQFPFLSQCVIRIFRNSKSTRPRAIKSCTPPIRKCDWMRFCMASTNIIIVMIRHIVSLFSLNCSIFSGRLMLQ